jgi:GntR family transcriptional regulator
MIINSHSKIPYYMQLKDIIVEMIDSGIFKRGEQIPTENELAAQHGISRPTVRQALGELVQEGYLLKKRGLGTFVSNPVFSGDASTFTTFAEEMAATGLQHRAKVVRKTMLNATERIAQDLGIKPSAQVYEIVRVRMANDEPLVIRTSIIPCHLYPLLLEEDLETVALYDTLAKKGIVPYRSKQSFQAVGANHEEAHLLQIPLGAPLILWTGIVFSENDMPIEKVRALYSGSRFRFTIDQKREPRQPVMQDLGMWNGMTAIDF